MQFVEQSLRQSHAADALMVTTLRMHQQEQFCPAGTGRQQDNLHFPCQNKRGLQLHNLAIVFDRLRLLHVHLQVCCSCCCRMSQAA